MEGQGLPTHIPFYATCFCRLPIVFGGEVLVVGKNATLADVFQIGLLFQGLQREKQLA